MKLFGRLSKGKTVGKRQISIIRLGLGNIKKSTCNLELIIYTKFYTEFTLNYNSKVNKYGFHSEGMKSIFIHIVLLVMLEAQNV